VAKFDPTGTILLYSVYLGGSRGDGANGIALDTAGDVFVTGATNSPDFPTTSNAFQPLLQVASSCLCDDAFVSELDPAGNLVYSTFLGGGGEDSGLAIRFDPAGHVHVAGQAADTAISGVNALPNFPTTTSIDPSPGSATAFYSRLTIGTTGTTLDYSVMFGGRQQTAVWGLAVDGTGLAYLTGFTKSSSGFPLKNALQATYIGGQEEGFVTVLDPSQTGGASVVTSTYLGGSGEDAGIGVAPDGSGGVYVAGSTNSADFPTSNAAQPRLNLGLNQDHSDFFLTKLSDNARTVDFSTYLGGSGFENSIGGSGQFGKIGGLAVDAAGDAFLTGITRSSDLPLVAPVQATPSNIAVIEVAPSGGLAFSTYLSSGFDAQPNGLAVNDTGVYITGGGFAADFPTANRTHDNLGVGQDAFVAKLSLPPPVHATHAVADFDGNGATDASVFRPSSATWFADSGTTVGWGAAGDVAVPGDYDGDGKTDEAIFRPSTGLWAIHGSAGTDTFVTYGVGSDTPVPADYDSDGKADIAVYRASTGTWFIHRSTDGTDTAVTFGGIAGDIPVPADYDGDAKADIAIFRSGTWYVHPSGGGADTAVTWGASGDVPVPADYDGDAKADIAIYRPSTGLWAIHPSGGSGDASLTYGGIAGDVPVPSDYDGDGKADIAIFRPSTGAWFEHRGGLSPTATDTVVTFGISGDVALPLPEAVRRTYF
jgi:hypothetical protein